MSKNPARPSRVWGWSIEAANHHRLMRLQHSSAPKQCNSWPHPQRRAQRLQSDQSNWNSSAGPVSIGTVTNAEPGAPRDGPRTERRYRVKVGYEPSKPSALITRMIELACSCAFCANNPAIRACHRSSITTSAAGARRAGGGPPFFNQPDTVAG
jgi:hypothetical protein